MRSSYLLLLCQLVVVIATVALAADGEACTNCAQNTANDLKVLNFALTLEHLEAYFYRIYQHQFSASDFADAGYDASVYDRFALIAAHEAAHAAFLARVIEARGGDPVPECTYTFPVTSVQTYVGVAQVLENVGVSAYDGGLNGLTDPDLAQTAATIATVEARHASYLNQLVGQVPFPNITDLPRTPLEVVTLARAFIVACPYAWNDTQALPVVRPNGASFVSTQASPPSAASSLPRGTYTDEQYANDLLTLNYALTLEQLEANFYAEGLKAQNNGAFLASGYNQSVYDNFVLIAQHEAAHSAALEAVIRSRGGTPVEPCTYQFDFSTVQAFVQTAAVLENTGVSAYDGSVNTLSDTGLIELAATVATVEARHAAYLNQLNLVLPFNISALDTALPPKAIVAAAGQFIKSCPNGRDPSQNLPSAAPQAQSPCAPSRPVLSDGASCSLSGLAIGGVSLFPTFSSAATRYKCAVSNNPANTSGSVMVTVTSDALAAVLQLNSSSGAQMLASGVASFPVSLNTGTGIAISVGVPGVLLALGDSITFGETDLSYVVSTGDRGYVSLVADFIDVQNGAAPRPIVQNLAIDGETAASFMTGVGRTKPVDTRNDTVLAAQNAHYSQDVDPQARMLNQSIANYTRDGLIVQNIVITLGFNELAALANTTDGTKQIMQTLSDYRSNYREVLRLVRSLAPAAELYLVGYFNPFPADPSSPAAPIFEMGGSMLNSIVAELAVEFFGRFVDTSVPFLGREAELTYIATQPAGFQLTDAAAPGIVPIGNVHPNAAGYSIIAQQVIAKVTEQGVLAGSCGQTYTVSCSTSDTGSTAGASGTANDTQPGSKISSASTVATGAFPGYLLVMAVVSLFIHA